MLNHYHASLLTPRSDADLSIWYGPDTCMGYNLQTMFRKVR